MSCWLVTAPLLPATAISAVRSPSDKLSFLQPEADWTVTQALCCSSDESGIKRVAADGIGTLEVSWQLQRMWATVHQLIGKPCVKESPEEDYLQTSGGLRLQRSYGQAL